jgi:CRP-like cAMP-binding protein
MIFGVISFSFATGALSSIITNIDSTEAKTKQKMSTLSEIQQDYELDDELFNKLVNSIKYDHNKKQKDLLKFTEELPHKLKIELEMAIYMKMYSSVNFFKNRDQCFIAWIGSMVHQTHVQEMKVICRAKEEVLDMYFLVSGKAAYIIEKYKKPYIDIECGSHFGHVELFGRRALQDNLEIQRSTTSTAKKHKNDRVFTIQAQTNCDMLSLSIKDLDRMRDDFADIYQELFDDGHSRYKQEMKLMRRTFRREVREEGTLKGRLALLLSRGDAGSISSDSEINHNRKSLGKSKSSVEPSFQKFFRG